MNKQSFFPLLLLLLAGCQSMNQNRPRHSDLQVSATDFLINQVCQETKCNVWADDVMGPNVCMSAYPVYDLKVNKLYFEFNFIPDSKEEVDYFQNSDESVREALLKRDVSHVSYELKMLLGLTKVFSTVENDTKD